MSFLIKTPVFQDIFPKTLLTLFQLHKEVLNLHIYTSGCAESTYMTTSVTSCWETEVKVEHSPAWEQNILLTVTLTQVVKPSVHDARFCGVNSLDLVSAQRPSWQSVVVDVPAIETLKPDFGSTSQEPLCCSSIRTDRFDPLIVHPEKKNTTNTEFSTKWWRLFISHGLNGSLPTGSVIFTWVNHPMFVWLITYHEKRRNVFAFRHYLFYFFCP